MVFVTQDKVFYGVSAFLGVLAIIWFGYEYLTSLSPFTISSILAALFLSFLGLGLHIKGNASVLSYILSAGSYITAMTYTVFEFGIGVNGVMLGLVLSSGLFAALGHLIAQKDPVINRNQLITGIGALILLTGGLVFYDIFYHEINFEESFYDEVEISERVEAGEMKVEKQGFLPKESDGPSFPVCIYNETELTGTSSIAPEYPETKTFGSISETITIEFDLRDDPGLSSPVPLEVDEKGFRCDEEVEGPLIEVKAEPEPVVH